MTSIATVALKPGMELAEDVCNFNNEVLVPANTILKEEHIKKLSRHSIMCVAIKEQIDYATTHFEKIRLSTEFKKFEAVYMENLTKYKAFMISFVTNSISFHVSQLMEIYHTVAACASSGEKLLDYLYHMLPSEDDMTHSHCLNSALIAGVFAKWLNLTKEDTDILIKCGFLYDVGKLKLPNELIWKPDRLTEDEYEQVKSHTYIGYQMLEKLHLDNHILRAALMHHERYDGSGYPDMLVGDQIDRFAKYIAIIDSYEAMTSARMYRQSLHPFQVIEKFEKAGFLTYEEEILRPILSHIASTQMGLTARLNDNRTGEIILINQKHLSRPLLRTSDGLIDLSTNPDLKIEAIF